jgi:hypothetical protein
VVRSSAAVVLSGSRGDHDIGDDRSEVEVCAHDTHLGVTRLRKHAVAHFMGEDGSQHADPLSAFPLRQ